MKNNSDINILLVEDEEQFLDSMAYSLKKNGFNVYTATSGIAAVEIIKKCVSDQKSIDLVVTDIQMSGMNGEELIGHIEDIYSETKIMAITGYSDDELFTRLSKTICRELLKKPFTNKIFVQKIFSLLKQIKKS